MGLRDLEEDGVEEERSRKLRRGNGPKDGNSHKGHPLFEGPSLKSFTCSVKIHCCKWMCFCLFLPLLAKCYLLKEFGIFYIVLHFGENSRTGQSKKGQTSLHQPLIPRDSSGDETVECFVPIYKLTF